MLIYKWLEIWVVADTSAKTCYSIPTSSAIYMQEAADVSITLANTHIDGASSFVSTNEDHKLIRKACGGCQLDIL